MLIEHFGFQTTFLITACIKTASFIPLVVLLCVLKEGPHRSSCLPLWGSRRPAAAPQNNVEETADGTLQAPLLGRAGEQSQTIHREE